jgi:hypothetical protein
MFSKLQNMRIRDFFRPERRIDDMLINQGRLFGLVANGSEKRYLWEREFKVFSQWGEDGIIQFLISQLKIENRTFIEFGVEDFFESNCRYLLMKDYWEGFVIDGSDGNLRRLRNSYFFWKYQIQFKASFITASNVNSLLSQSGFKPNVGIMSVDIDGVDYFVLREALRFWFPSILIVEYNGLFGPDKAISVPYDESFRRSVAHFSQVYYGASLSAFDHLARKNGYSLVGVNGAGSNAFFVRDELLNDRVYKVGVKEVFRWPSFREERDRAGKLTYRDRVKVISDVCHLPVVDVVTGDEMQLGKDLPGVF